MISHDELLNELHEQMGMNTKRKLNKKYPTIYDGRQVTPLVEIHSVSIHTSYDAQNCQIYGRIRVFDDDDEYGGDNFDIFNRDDDDPECVDLNNSNSLLLLNHSNIIVPSETVKVDVLLRDKAHSNAILAQGVFTLRRTVVDCKGEVQYESVKGDVGSVDVHYSIFPFAVVATVSMLYFNKDDDFDLISDDRYNAEGDFVGGNPNDSDDGHLEENVVWDYINYDKRELATTSSSFTNVFGSVIAYNDIVLEGSTDNNASVLFRKSPEQSVQLSSGNFIELSRSIVVVPVNSSLKIQVDLHDSSSPFGIYIVEFIPQDRGTVKKDVVGANGRIRVRVKWGDGYRQLRREEELETEELHSEPLSPSPQQMCSIGGMPSAYPYSNSIPSPMAEVFSVVVCGNDFKPFSFYGNIKDNGSLWRGLLFSTNRDSPLHCSELSGTFVNFSCHHTLDVMDEFSLWLTFKDAADKSVIIKGLIGWKEGYYAKKWVDRPLCSLIRGDRAFAAIHYAIFSDGISVKLDAKLNGVSASTRISGTIVAHYGTVDFDYSKFYEKKYYKSVVFNMETLLEGPDYRLPLLKSIVNVPSNSSLVLDVDVLLWVDNADDGRKERLQKSIEIEYYSAGKTVEEIQEGKVSLEVTASYNEWIYYPKPPEKLLQSV